MKIRPGLMSAPPLPHAVHTTHIEAVNVISKSQQNRSAFSMTPAITTAKDGRLGADT